MKNSYDQLIYESLPRRESHPAHLASIAKLFSINCALPSKARILELGCGTGGILIPLAELWPDSSFLGIDLSASQVDLGLKVVQDLNLKNIVLKQLSILDFPAEAGTFDYIICHGVFSWVDREIQDKILNILAKHLSEEGLAYISYNALPGWRYKGALREMMQYHTSGIDEPEEKARQAKALVQFLAESQNDLDSPYSRNLQQSAQELRSVPEHYLYHEYLEKQNQAYYFHEFIDRLDAARLAYVSDAQFSLTTFVDLPAQTQSLLESLSDRVKFEQYLDFIRNRRLRESIICRNPKDIIFPIIKPKLDSFYIAAQFVSEYKVLTEGQVVTAFKTSKGGEIKSNNSLTIEAMRVLHKIWPEQIRFDDLIREALERLNLKWNDPIAEVQRINFEEELFLFYSANLIELELYSYRATSDYTGHPRASNLARQQALKQERITSLRHEAIMLESIVRQILFFLDGSRDMASVVDELTTLVDKGELTVKLDPTDLAQGGIREFFLTIVERSFKVLAKNSFFLAS